MAKFHGWYFWSRTQIDMPARLIIRLLFGFASDSVLLNHSTNSETEMLWQERNIKYGPHIVVDAKKQMCPVSPLIST